MKTTSSLGQLRQTEDIGAQGMAILLKAELPFLSLQDNVKFGRKDGQTSLS